jgi:hypothetical protein
MSSSSNLPITPAEESVAFYYYIGIAISNWALLESGLFWLASLCFTESDHYNVAVTLFSIDAFYNKLKVIDRLVKGRYGKTKHAPKWTAISSELQRLSKLRNALAHYRMLEYPHGKPGKRISLEPYIVMSRQPQRTPRPPSGALCLEDIFEASRTFNVMFSSLQVFYHELKNDEALLPESAEIAPYAMTMKQLTRQIRTTFSKLAAPSST